MEKELEQAKTSLFNLYRGQEVFYLVGLGKLRSEPDQQILEGDILLLTPLSLISDEDAIKVANLHKEYSDEPPRNNKGLRDWGIGICMCKSFNHKSYQHLIQSGYAVDFYDAALGRVIKVEEQVSLGWVKLREG